MPEALLSNAGTLFSDSLINADGGGIGMSQKSIAIGSWRDFSREGQVKSGGRNFVKAKNAGTQF